MLVFMQISVKIHVKIIFAKISIPYVITLLILLTQIMFKLVFFTITQQLIGLFSMIRLFTIHLINALNYVIALQNAI